MDNDFGHWVNLHGEIGVIDSHSATQKRDIKERQQSRASPLENLGPFWPSWAQANLSVEELDVGLIESVLFQAGDIRRALPK